MNPVLPYPVAIIVAAALIVLTVIAYRRFSPPVPRRIARILWALRGAAILAVLVLLFRPEVESFRLEERTAALIFLVDGSKSMGISDESAPGKSVRTSRAKALVDAVAATGDAYKRLGATYKIKVFHFGVSLRAGDSLSAGTGDEATRLGDALGELSRRNLADPIAAVVLLSDGGENLSTVTTPADGARALGRRGVPVFCVPLGLDRVGETLRDVSAQGLSCPRVAFVGNRVRVRALFRLLGLAGKSVRFSLKVGGREVDSKTVRAEKLDDLREVVFTPELKSGGFTKITVEAEAVDGELSHGNNRLSTFVRVDTKRVKVL
ncbi:MAG: vWA domain-containing protein, partial [Planctomycetia bacterium]|nr:vWA domain-containing protein [Planctomycetia bacterium]